MELSKKYCLVQSLEPLNTEQEFASENWPLHCTIAGVFALDWSEKLRQELDEIISRHNSFQSIAMDEAWFGPDRSIEVRLLEMTSKLYGLHDDVVSFVERHGDKFKEPRFLRQDFHPHVTMQNNKPENGESVLFHNLSLIDMSPNADRTRRRVIGSFALATNQQPSD